MICLNYICKLIGNNLWDVTGNPINEIFLNLGVFLESCFTEIDSYPS